MALLCLVLILSVAASRPGAAMPAGLTSPTGGLYLADGNASPGAVYRLQNGGSLFTYYTRPAGALTHFAFSPAGDLYYLDANGYSIYTSTPDGEQVHFTHSTYVSDLAFGADGLLYFSDASGGGGDGHIWRLVGGFAGWVPELFYTVSLVSVNGYWGGHGLDSVVTLWINRDDQGGAAPGPADLRLRLLPDGTLEAGTGDGRAYNAPAPTVFASQIISDTRFALQEDIRTVDSPWWAGEVRIPLEALSPYAPGQPLRLALSFEGTIAAGALPDQPEETTVMGGWPASFEPLQPDTWGEATTDRPLTELYLPLVGRQYSGPRSAEGAGHDAPSGDTS